MRYFVIKELNNNLYLSDMYATKKIVEAMIYNNIEDALEDIKDESVTWDFLSGLNFNIEEMTADVYKLAKEMLNIRVIPIEITEGCYIE